MMPLAFTHPTYGQLIVGSTKSASRIVPAVVAGIPELVDGLHTGATAVGRTETTTPETVGNLPAGASLGATKVTFTADNVTLYNFDLEGYDIDFNNRQNCLVEQCKLKVAASGGSAVAHILIQPGANGSRVRYCDAFGHYGPTGEDALIKQQWSGATCATGVVIERNRFKWMSNDGLHTAGGGILIKENYFDFPAQASQDVVLYSGTPGDYTTGDYVYYQYNGPWYVAQCRVATPTTNPTNVTTTDWLRGALPHTDIINPRASLGAGTTIDSNYCRDGWILDQGGATRQTGAERIANLNNWIRAVRNNGDTVEFAKLDVRNNKNDRNGYLASFPIALEGGTNYNGPIEFRDNRMGLNYGGVYVDKGSASISVWTGNTNQATDAPLAQP